MEIGDLHITRHISPCVRCCVVGNGSDDAICVLDNHPYPESEGRIFDEDVRQIVGEVDESWDVNLVDVDAVDAMHSSFDARHPIDPKFRLRFDVLPWYFRDVLGDRVEIDQLVDQFHALIQWTSVDDVD